MPEPGIHNPGRGDRELGLFSRPTPAGSATYCRIDLTLVTKIFYRLVVSPTAPGIPSRRRRRSGSAPPGNRSGLDWAGGRGASRSHVPRFSRVWGEGLIAVGGPGRERSRRISTSRAGVRACIGTRLRVRLVRRAVYSTTYCRSDLTLVTTIFYKGASSPTTPEAPFRCRPASRGRRRRRATALRGGRDGAVARPGGTRRSATRSHIPCAHTRGEQG
jgi:hypothetical protein